MLNHIQHYENITPYSKTGSQEFAYATHKENPEHRVIINQIKKTSLLLPIDVNSIINALHHLEMLEEDSEYWYLITTDTQGVTLFEPIAQNATPACVINTDHFLEFLNLIKDYYLLAPYYQMMLLSEKQFLLNNQQLKSKELLVLSNLDDEYIDFSTVKSQLLPLIGSFLVLLKNSEPAIYLDIDWTETFEASSKTVSLSELSTLWIDEIHRITNKIESTESTFLTGIYAIKASDAKAPSAIRRQAEADKRTELQSLRETPKNSSQGIKPAIIITLIIAFILLMIFVMPNLLEQIKRSDLFTGKEKSPSVQTSTTSIDNTKIETTSNETTNGNISNSTETLLTDQIKIIKGDWTYDEGQFYTGNKSLKLALSEKSPTGIIQLSPITLSKNTNLSLWMMSDSAGQVIATTRFYQNKKLIQTFETKIIFEAPMTWYLVNPLTDTASAHFSSADSLQFEISGTPQTLWLDDFLLESYK